MASRRMSAPTVRRCRPASARTVTSPPPNGFESNGGPDGSALSAGQRQRVALARALYRDPFLVVLDEPSSNLDAVGEEALTQAILGVRSRGGIIIVVAHRPSALAAVDHLLVMNQGRAQAFGPKD